MPRWAPGMLARAPKLQTCGQRWASSAVNALKPQDVVRLKQKLYIVHKNTSHSAGRGSGTFKLTLVDVATRTRVHETLRSGEMVETASLVTRPFRLLYRDAKARTLHIFNEDPYEELEVPQELLPNAEKTACFLVDGAELSVDFCDGRAVHVAAPARAVFTVVQTIANPTVIINEGKNSHMKPATLDNGESVHVPDFCKEGDRIYVDVAQGKYHSRLL